jgi:putative ABC transport system substrate-binding protein
MKKNLLYLSLLALFILPGGIKSAFPEEKSIIVVIRSRVIAPYNEALSGFEEEINRNGYKVSFYYNLEEIKGKEPQVISEIKASNPSLLFAIGTEATLFAKENIKSSPIVFSMVINPVATGIIQSITDTGDNLTGVSLDISPELQFRKLKEMLPKASRVGVIYNAKEKDWIKQIEAIANRMNLVIVAKPINSEADVPRALDEILGGIDCLWGQVDPLIYNAQSSQYILLALLRNKIPFMAFSAQYVKAGALLALECDYKDIGRQAGEIATKILKGGARGAVALTFPTKVRLVVNQRIAQVIGIDIPKKLLEEAKEVY